MMMKFMMMKFLKQFLISFLKHTSLSARVIAVIFLSGLTFATAQAQNSSGGPFGIDHRWEKDESGIFARQTQWNVLYAMLGTTVGGALWVGSDSRLGKTYWQGTDAFISALAGAVIVKNVFTRARPRDGNNPDLFFQGGSNESFVSGEVAVTTALVTPWILEYGKEQPLVYALALLPIYDGIARMKSQGHWQSDVLGAAALGVATGYWAHNRSTPLLLQVTGNTTFVGWKGSF